jgi:UDP-N-acetylglucosamine/UDP-N-acetylgalactosamine diphosphorylase
VGHIPIAAVLGFGSRAPTRTVCLLAQLESYVAARHHCAAAVAAAAAVALAQVLEYSELDPTTASATNPGTGKLFYNWSNICMHYFSLTWLKAAAQHLRNAAVYHIAHKQIPAKGGVTVPGLKLEMFIFDPFHTADKTTLFEVRDYL